MKRFFYLLSLLHSSPGNAKITDGGAVVTQLDAGTYRVFDVQLESRESIFNFFKTRSTKSENSGKNETKNF